METIQEMHAWSEYQQNIYSALKTTKANLAVDAVPGSGKSTTLFEIARIAHELGQSTLYLAFQKTIEVHATKKIQALGLSTKCRTFHGLGLWSLRTAGIMGEINEEKVPSKVEQYYPTPQDQPAYRRQWTPHRILLNSLRQIRQKAILGYDPSFLQDAIDEHVSYAADPEIYEKEFDYVHSDNGIAEIITALKELDNDKKIIDYDDMIRMPALFKTIAKTRRIRFKNALIDESQDMNAYQLSIIHQLFSNGARVVLVGDPRQSIYEFRGAFQNAMEEMAKMTSATWMPLSISYRCRSNIVDFINETCNATIEPFFPDGQVAYWTGSVVDMIEKAGINMVIASKNTTLVNIWTQLARAGIGSTLKGTHISARLLAILNSMKNIRSVSDVEMELDKRLAPRPKPFPAIYIELMRSMQTLIERFTPSSIQELRDLIVSMEAGASIHLYTVHAAKGLEADRVLVAEDWFSNPQLLNMKYVAWSRGKDLLVLWADQNSRSRVPSSMKGTKNASLHVLSQDEQNMTSLAPLMTA